MLKKPLLTLACALLLAAAFFYGVARLFVLRYERGDVYPPYSSLRADPLGVKGIYDALDRLPGVDATRNFRALPKLRPAAPVTLVYAGVTEYAQWESRELTVFDALVHDGTRAIFTFMPAASAPLPEQMKRAQAEARAQKEKARAEKKKPRGKKLGAKHAKEEAKKTDDEKKDEEESDPNPPVSFDEVAKRWGFGFDYLPPDKEKKSPRRAVLAEEKAKLEPDISWHTELCFNDL